MDDFKFTNYSNAKIINERETKITKIFMWKYEDAFLYLSGEPLAIEVQDEEQNESETYGEIFRLRMWDCERSSVSWSIYSSEDSEEIKQIIIRKVLWDKESDLKKRPRLKNEREKVLNELPSITTYNFFMPLKADSLIIELLSGLDALLDQGIVLSNENPSGRQWGDMELKRLFNWGQIHLTWCPNKTNTLLEAKLFEMMEEMERLINMEKEDIYSMEFIYELTPEKYLKDYYYKLIK